MAWSPEAVAGVLALGYEGPETAGALAVAAVLLLATVLITWLVVRTLVTFLAGEASRRRRG